jgi:hypothetical protein
MLPIVIGLDKKKVGLLNWPLIAFTFDSLASSA